MWPKFSESDKVVIAYALLWIVATCMMALPFLSLLLFPVP